MSSWDDIETDELWLTYAEAKAFAEQLRTEDRFVLGAEGFHGPSPDDLENDMRMIADFSRPKPPTPHEARQTVREIQVILDEWEQYGPDWISILVSRG